MSNCMCKVSMTNDNICPQVNSACHVVSHCIYWISFIKTYYILDLPPTMSAACAVLQCTADFLLVYNYAEYLDIFC